MSNLNPDDVLENAKGKMVNCLVVGMDAQDRIHMEMTNPSFAYANLILNRGLYEVNRMNSEQVVARINAAAEAEQNVREQVIVEAPKKRGRPRKAA